MFKNAQTLETQDSYLNTKLNTKNPLGVQVFNSHPNSRPHDLYPVHLPSIERPAGQAGSEMVTLLFIVPVTSAAGGAARARMSKPLALNQEGGITHE